MGASTLTSAQPQGQKGPFVTELESSGKGGKVIIPVVGAFAEMSPDVYAIIDPVATALTQKHLSYFDACRSVVKGMFQQRIYRSLGLSAQLGWARLVIDRTKTTSGTPAPATAQTTPTQLRTMPSRMRALPTPIAPLPSPTRNVLLPHTPPPPTQHPNKQQLHTIS